MYVGNFNKWKTKILGKSKKKSVSVYITHQKLVMFDKIFVIWSRPYQSMFPHRKLMSRLMLVFGNILAISMKDVSQLGNISVTLVQAQFKV